MDDSNDPNFYGSTPVLAFVDCVYNPFTIVDPNVSTTIVTNEVLWSLLAKQRKFWKPKSCNATTWAFYAINNILITLSKINSSHPEFE
jgi:hypothetical protein